MTTRGRYVPAHAGCSLILLAAACGEGAGLQSASGAGGGVTAASSTSTSGAAQGTGGAAQGAGGAAQGAGGAGGDVPLERFSFFITSLAAMQQLSQSQLGFGGDLRFGESGPGAGLRGADKICATIAETSMPGSAKKQWRAFLSAAAGEDGQPVDAIDRIGAGPWYDRLGRLVASTKGDLLHDRPEGADPAIEDDLPNETGAPNSQPDPTKPKDDNHHTMTGSTPAGTLYDAMKTCLDWTAAKGEPMTEGKPRMGLAYPRAGVPPSSSSMNWMSALTGPGCAPGVSLVQGPAPKPEDVDVGTGGGYGAIYCFALTP